MSLVLSGCLALLHGMCVTKQKTLKLSALILSGETEEERDSAKY